MKKKFLGITSALCAVAMAVSVTGCKKETTPTDAEVASFVSLDINPSIELTLDTDNKVVSVVGTNEDGQVLLYGEDGFIGLDVQTAVGKITDLAIDLGYIDDENKVVEATVTAKTEDAKNGIEDVINANIKASASKAGIEVKVEGEGTYSLNRKLDELKAQYPQNAVIQALNVPKFKLALSATETGEVDIVTAVEMDDEELIKLVSNAHKQVKEYATEAYNKAKAEALNAYDIATGLALDSVYTTFYAKNLLTHTATAYLGGAYQAYNFGAVGFNAVASVLEFAEKVETYPIPEERVVAVIEALGLPAENVELLKDSDGNVTVKSVENYADKLFKNSEASAQIEQMKDELTAALKYAETDIKTLVLTEVEKYKPQIETIIEATGTVVDTVKGTIGALPEFITQGVNATLAEFEAVVAEVEEILAMGMPTAATLREFADKLEKRADAILVLIEADLSEEELAEIADMKADIEKGFATAKAAFENAMAKAEADAKAQIEAIKQARAK